MATVLLVLLLLTASPVAASSITAPLEGNITYAELARLVDLGPLTWTTDADMVIAQFWDEEPGIGATVKHPGYALDVFETATSTTAVLNSAGLLRLGVCGRWQFDFERYPLDHSTIKSLVIDMGVACQPIDPPRITQPDTPGTPVPEPATLCLLGVGLACLGRHLRRRGLAVFLVIGVVGVAHAEERPAALVPLYAAAGTLHALDLQSTYAGLNRGGHEANPLMRGIVTSPASFAVVKAGALVGTVALSERLWRTGHRPLALIVMGVSNGLLVAVVAHNRRVLQ